jgi:tetratricopeptide (TPR) repeat protein
MRGGGKEQAMPRLDQRLGFTRYEADEAYKQALEFYRKGAFDDAVDMMTRAIEALPTNAEYFAARGLMLLEDGVLDGAHEDFRQALALFPYEMLAHYGCGVIAYRSEEWDAALNHFTHAFHAQTERPETLYYLALVYHQRGETANAVNLMGRALALFEQVGDKRKSDAVKWLRQMAKAGEKQER